RGQRERGACSGQRNSDAKSHRRNGAGMQSGIIRGKRSEIRNQKEKVMALVSRTPLSLSHATSEVECPSGGLAALLPLDWPQDIPLARVRTCGTLVVEVLIDLRADSHGRLEPVYSAPEVHILKIKGMSTAFLLLAL